MTLRLYNTLTKEKDELAPLFTDADGKPHVRMYVCGPTVYDFAHIGNARPVIVFDVLFRLLRHLYGADHVTYVRNITDVDDKINARAAVEYPDLPLNEAIRRVTEKTDAQFQADVAALGCLPPSEQPRATEHIDAMKAMIERLIEKGVAYVAEGHVLFSPSEMNRLDHGLPRYGQLARRSLDEMLAGARVDVAPYKREAMDFVLWKPSDDHEPGWPSPAGIPGRGRPGWHIECSAMSMAKLLEPFGGGLSCDDPQKNTFDIHGGGIDLVFPHHENEIAQSCCAFGSPRMANIWMHNGFLQVEGEKMSKSTGNFVTIRELLNDWPGEVLRLNMLKTHYRQPIDWTLKGLEESANMLSSWHRLADLAKDAIVDPSFVEALKDDLNTPMAIQHVSSWTKAKPGQVFSSASFLGHGFLIPSDVAERAQLMRGALALLGLLPPDRQVDVARVNALITARLEARKAKNFAEADRIRNELDAMGIALKDAKDPATGEIVTTWEVKR
ncbi:cysteine--tRNA ligase [Kaistia dalseonensis]|uniref:Cysteine--tRNA ligase n=1 Tax=Kaistia dalseonensis TaxID=410840 RepID=A0ABU0H3J8_9HYPH|nr:cysteine--tRNA ligase [Kaistia dalseonensis]MCX5493902.1 cysteine--tRNA ligase [Kaistia dalseonensis]MDQ0436468.1 cysteinyl-tRNA synthetase [Kaistia dalseonensis]